MTDSRVPRSLTLCTTATVREKDIFSAFCKSQGMGPSDMLRFLISQECPEIPFRKTGRFRNSGIEPDAPDSVTVISTVVRAAERAIFFAFCERQGCKTSIMLRTLISKVCPEISATDCQLRQAVPRKFSIRFAKREADAVRTMAQMEGGSASNLIRRTVRAVISKKPISTVEAEQALRKSNLELAAFGREINQIAHALNISLDAAHLVNPQLLQRLESEISRHFQVVTTLLNLSWERYADGSDLERGEDACEP